MTDLLTGKNGKASYSRCINCGKYIETYIKGKSLYCSSPCTEYFGKCDICGKYYSNTVMHYDSVKCMVKFDINKKGNPFIRQTLLKIFLTGSPLLNTELLTERLSLVLKLPVFMSEQFRIDDLLSSSEIQTRVNQKIKAENISEHFIFLGNTHNIDFLEDLFKSFAFDKFVIFRKSEQPDITSNQYTESTKNQICTQCGNVNCFSQSDYEGKTECLVCGNEYFRTTEGESAIHQKIKNYRDCEDYISSSFPEKCIFVNFTTIHDTVNEIVKYLIYT